MPVIIIQQQLLFCHLSNDELLTAQRPDPFMSAKDSLAQMITVGAIGASILGGTVVVLTFYRIIATSRLLSILAR
jgi:hypothetical protein